MLRKSVTLIMVHASSSEVLEELRAELNKVWGRGRAGVDNKMVLWSLKDHYDEVVKLPVSGMLFATEKPKLKTSFCFGYDTFGPNTCEEASRRESAFLKSKTAFLNENLGPLDRQIAMIEKDGKEHDYSCAHLCLCPHFEDSNIVSVTNLTPNSYYGMQYWETHQLPEGHIELAPEDKAVILETMKVTRAKFAKRCETYLKKYGTSKLRTWTYWRDE